ncbi:putative Leucine-rich repeat-containing protein 15 [Hypsibius exemplaris]|uniref:Leucine-rich repeat-containing protein 15 n=1 Tax=Hypsibius exemplaris TaxID=2072580 RepID=A0A9X6RLU2_HYPEX|nr:putative Leucine-rich repeat-containing protein 15 [Hypsibius exemplaris]
MKQLVIFLLILALQPAVWAQMHRRCPVGCKCDFENAFKRVRCEVADSAVNINFNDLDNDIQFLEVLPRQRGRTDAFGPALPDAFGEFHQLQRLVIRNNGIQRIPAAAGRQLASVTTLDLAGNDIQSLKDLSFENLPNLRSLQLSSNKIDSITDDSFRALRELKLLALNTNAIRSVSPGAFQSQQYLEHLELRNNRLQDLPSSIFDSLIRVDYLDLRGNQLAVVPRGIQRLLGMIVLLLDDNRISTVPNALIQAWRSSEVLADVSLFGNPLVCDDALNDFIAWTKTPDGFKKVCDIASVRGIQGSSGRAKCPTCDGPRGAAGQTVDMVNSRDFQLQSDQQGKGSFAITSGQGSRPATKPSDQDYAVFRVVDSARAPDTFDPRRDASRPASNSKADQTMVKLKKYMPGAGVRCGQQSCYYFSAKGTKEWRTAEYNCQSVGLDLVEIGSAAEQKDLMRFLIEAVKESPQRTSMSRGWWIGYKFDPRSHNVISATTGRTSPYTNWAPGQPNSLATQEECLELWDTGDWNDGRCTLPMENQYICESPLDVGQGLNLQNNALSSSSKGGSGSGGRRTSSGTAASSGASKFDTVSFTVFD